ncbi:MAG: hypothetical protein ACLUOI_25770 [Eisenbergiella sp.]
MKEVTVGSNEAGQRLDKFLKKYLKEAGSGFLYKMLRKKNITLNGAKADGSEKLIQGDRVCFFLSEETLEKFRGPAPDIASGNLGNQKGNKPERAGKKASVPRVPVIYEDDNILLLNKPAGLCHRKLA